MKSRKWLWVALLLCLPAKSDAWIHGNAGATGSAQINLGGNAFIPANFINVFKTAAIIFNTPSDAGKIDDDGYLTSSPSGNVGISFPASGTMWSGVQYKLRWDAGVQFSSLTFNNAMSSCSATAATVTGCSGASATITTTGGAGSVTFTTSATQFSAFFTSGGTFSHSSGALSLYRVSDETDFLAGEFFTPEFKTTLKGLNPKTIRPMGWVQVGPANFNGETTWNYRNKLTNFTWSVRYPPGAWGGTIGGTDTYTGAAAPDTPGVWTDGETYTGVFTNANTSTTPTLNINSRGPKTIINNDAITALSAGSIAAGSIGTVVYDGILGKLLYSIAAPSGIFAGVPVEAQAQLANRVNANLWATIPAWATDNYVTNWATTACSNLSGSLYLYPEYSNEVWNFAFPQSNWASQRGQAFGWVTGANQSLYGWYGLRVRLIMGNLIPASCSGHLLRRVMAYQAAGDTTNQANRFEGSQLTPGNAAYNTYTGSANYSAAPNRPIDVTEVLSYSAYSGGTNLCLGPDLGCAPTAANAPFYQSVVTNYESGGAGITTAIALVDNDVRLGVTNAQTVTAAATTFTTPLAHGFVANTTDVMFTVTGGTINSGITANTIYRVTSTGTSTTFTIQPYVGGFPSGANVNAGSAGSGTVTVGVTGQQNMAKMASNWEQFGETNAARYNASRGSLAALRVEWYEGNLEPVGPSSAQCTALSITGTNCTGSIAAAILAWKADPSSKATQTAYYNQFIGTDAAIPPTFGLMPHSKTPSQLVLPNVCGGGVLTGAGAYALLSDCLPNSTPYQLYNGFAAFHGVP